MAYIKCKLGHFYDDSKFEECPSCQNIDEYDSAPTLLEESVISEFVADYSEEDIKGALQKLLDEEEEN